MSRDKQIEKMYKNVYEAVEHNSVIDVIHGGYIGINTEGLTKELYDDGYRKASDVARNIFGNLRILGYIDFDGNMCIRKDSFEELEKQYTEGEG